VERNNFRDGFLPVTCHLTCPVTDFINKQTTGREQFDPGAFHGWPELKEAYLSGYTPATFILAPMAIALREQGVPIKIVYLGHREGGDVMVHKDSGIYRTRICAARPVAVPGGTANHRLIFYRELKKADEAERREPRRDAAAGHAARSTHARSMRSPPAEPFPGRRRWMATVARSTA
jgi:NitT/TauT family transport system substrate-binding protein